MAAQGTKIRDAKELVELLAENPLALINALTEIITILLNLGVLDELVRAAIDQFQQLQERNN